MLRRTRHICIRLLGAVFVGLIAAIAFVTWRLSQGPVSLAILVPTVQTALARPDLGLSVAIADARLIWTDLTADPQIVAIDVHARGPDGTELLAVPELRLTLSGRALLSATIAPARIEVSGLHLALVRRLDGQIDFGLRAPGTAAPPQTGDAAEDATLPAFNIPDLLEPPQSGKPGAYLREVRFDDASVVLRNQRRGTVWQAAPAQVRLLRDQTGVRLSAALAVEAGGRTGSARFEAYRRPNGAETTLSADLADVRMDLLAPFLPDPSLATIVDAPVSGRLSVVVAEDDRVTAAEASLAVSAGRLLVPGAAGALPINRAVIQARWDAIARRLAVERALLATGGREMTVAGTVAVRDGGFGVDARFDGLRPHLLATPLGMADLAGLEFPLSGTVQGSLDAMGKPTGGRLDIAFGAGKVARPGFFQDPLDLRGGGIKLALEQQGRRIALEQATLDVGPVLSAKGGAVLDRERWTIDLDSELRNVAAADLRRLWPVTAASGGRRWVVANIREATVPRVRAKLGMVLRATPDGGFGEPVSQTVAGSFEFSNLTARYWDPMPPLRDGKGSGTFSEKRLEIKVESARDGHIAVEDGSVVLAGFDTGPGTAEIDTGLKSPFTDLMTLLDRPPLGYAKKLKVDPSELAGQVQGRLRIKLPLLANVLMDQIELGAKATVDGATLPRVALDRALTEGKVEVDVDKRRIVARGAGKFGGSPVRFEAMQAFESKAREQLRAEASLTLDDAARRSYGFDTPPLTVDGGLQAQIRYLELSGGRGELNGTLNLAPATLGLKQIGWTKPAGQPASATLALVLQNGRAVSIDRVTLKADKFDGEAKVTFDAAGKARQIDVSRLRYAGDTDIAMRATLADRLITIDARGAAFDLQPILSDVGKPGPDGAEPAAPSPEEPEFRVTARIDRLRLSSGPVLRGVSAQVRLVQGDIVAGRVDADTATAANVTMTIADSGGRRHVSVDSADAGAVFAALDLTDQMRGGKLTLRADRNPADPKSPYAGRIDVAEFRLVNAPFMARLLGAAAITGIGDLLSADSGLGFTALEAPFRFRAGRFDLEPGRAYGTSVGITWRGAMDTRRNTIDIAGTVVPIYAVNRVLGAIPIVGYLITGGQGSGALAATYRATGALDQPQISVNPLSMLVPGFIRSLFGSIVGQPGETPPPDGAAPAAPPPPARHPAWDPSGDPAGGLRSGP